MLTKIDRAKLDNYFNELAKIYKKKSHGYVFEFVLVGGASILVNYNFRDTTNDIDAFFLPSADIKDAIHAVSEKFSISANWINNDFQKTKSFSNKLSTFSTYYKAYKNIITVRTIKDEYLIAMKLMSGRKYKNDISDIVGIISSARDLGNDISFQMIDNAVNNLYGNWKRIDEDMVEILHLVLKTKNLKELYEETIKEENNSRLQLLDFNDTYNVTINESNINDILKMLNKNSGSHNAHYYLF